MDTTVPVERITSKIYLFRGIKVMLDSDLAEFYDIINGNGGFDVVIGNPPYVQYSNRISYSLNNYKTFKTKNLYAFCIERSLNNKQPRPEDVVVYWCATECIDCHSQSQS